MANEDSKRLKTISNIKENEENSNKIITSTKDLILMTEEEKILAVPFSRTDVAFVFTNAEGSIDRLFANKEQLIKISPVFEAMFSSNFKESSADEVPLPGKNMSTFLRFLRLALPGQLDKLAVETAREVLPLVQEYQVQGLKDRIDLLLSDTTTATWDNIYNKLHSFQLIANIIEAEEYGLDKYLDASITLAAKRKHTDFVSQPRYEQISTETQYKIKDQRMMLVEKFYTENICYTGWSVDVDSNDWRYRHISNNGGARELVRLLKEKFDFFMQ